MSSLPKSKPRTVYAWRVVDCDPANGWVNENPGVVFFGNDGRARMGSPHTTPNGRRLWKFADAEFPRGLRYDEILATRYYLPVFEPVRVYYNRGQVPWIRYAGVDNVNEDESYLDQCLDALQDFLQVLHSKPKLTLAERMMRLKCYQAVSGMVGQARGGPAMALEASERGFRFACVDCGGSFDGSVLDFTPDPYAAPTVRILREWLGEMVECPETIIERLEQRDGVA